MDPLGSAGLVSDRLFSYLCTMKHEQTFLTHKEAVKKALEELGGRARLRDIYPRVIPYIMFKPGSDIRATLRRVLQTTPELFRRTEGRRGWWELVSYQEELAERDRRIAELTQSQITKAVIIQAFNDCNNLVERTFAMQTMDRLFGGIDVWKIACKEMKKAGYFNDPQPVIIIDRPQIDLNIDRHIEHADVAVGVAESGSTVFHHKIEKNGQE